MDRGPQPAPQGLWQPGFLGHPPGWAVPGPGVLGPGAAYWVSHSGPESPVKRLEVAECRWHTAPHGTASPDGWAPGGLQPWVVLREAKVAQVQVRGCPGLATPPPSTAAGADTPPAGRSIPREKQKGRGQRALNCSVRGLRPASPPMLGQLCPGPQSLPPCLNPEKLWIPTASAPDTWQEGDGGLRSSMVLQAPPFYLP